MQEFISLLGQVGPYFGYFALFITSGMFVRHSYLISALRMANENVATQGTSLALAKQANLDLLAQVGELRIQVAELSLKIDNYQQVIASQASENLILRHAVEANNLLTQQATLANTVLLQRASAAEALLQQRALSAANELTAHAAIASEVLSAQAAVLMADTHPTPAT